MSHRTHETFTHDGYMSPMMGICRHGYMSHGYMSPNPSCLSKYLIVSLVFVTWGESLCSQRSSTSTSLGLTSCVDIYHLCRNSLFLGFSPPSPNCSLWSWPSWGCRALCATIPHQTRFNFWKRNHSEILKIEYFRFDSEWVSQSASLSVFFCA